VKEQRANAGTRNRGTINNKDRIGSTMYPLGIWFVSGMCVWISCIKETTMMMIMIIIIIISYSLLTYCMNSNGQQRKQHNIQANNKGQ